MLICLMATPKLQFCRETHIIKSGEDLKGLYIHPYASNGYCTLYLTALHMFPYYLNQRLLSN